MFGTYGAGASIIFGLFLVVSLLGLFAAPQIIERNLLRPYQVVRRQEYATLVTSGFIHADLGHLLFNSITFYFFAFPLERYIGTMAFVALYFIALLVSSLDTVYRRRNDPNYASLGASGAILGVLFASIIYFPEQKLFIIPIPVPIPAPLFALGYLAFTWYSARQQTGRINHDAHLSGALTGLAFVALTDPGAYANLMRLVTG